MNPTMTAANIYTSENIKANENLLFISYSIQDETQTVENVTEFLL